MRPAPYGTMPPCDSPKHHSQSRYPPDLPLSTSSFLLSLLLLGLMFSLNRWAGGTFLISLSLSSGGGFVSPGICTSSQREHVRILRPATMAMTAHLRFRIPIVHR